MSAQASPAPPESQINFDNEYDDDELYEQKLREVESDIKSITSTQISEEEATNGNVDTKLQFVLTNRSYEAIIKSAQERARSEYLSNLTPEMDFLLQNHLNIQKEYGTRYDNENNWRIDTDNATDEELNREVERLKKKLDRIKAENEKLENEKDQEENKLEFIQVQNGKLESRIPKKSE